MLYSHLKIWLQEGQFWHSLYRPGTRDMSMGICPKPKETIAWAETHNMTIIIFGAAAVQRITTG